jgi:hypothetical protein
VAKPKAEASKVRRSVAVKVDRDLVAKARVIAAHGETTATAVISRIARGPIDAEYRRVVQTMARAGA